jgi:hypothetical protein
VREGDSREEGMGGACGRQQAGVEGEGSHGSVCCEHPRRRKLAPAAGWGRQPTHLAGHALQGIQCLLPLLALQS